MSSAEFDHPPIQPAPDSPYKASINPDGSQSISAAESYETPGGLVFDDYRRAEQAQLAIKADAIDRMADVVAQFEPDLVDKIPHGVFFEYITAKLIEKSKEPAVKKMLVQILVDAEVKLKRFSSAVRTLLQADVDQLEIPELQNPKFIGSLAEGARAQGDVSGEYQIYHTVADLERKGTLQARLFKHGEFDRKYMTGWEARELQLLEKMTLEVLERIKQGENHSIGTELRQQLESLKLDWEARELFMKKERSVLAQQLFDAYFHEMEFAGNVGKFAQRQAKDLGVHVEITAPNDSVPEVSKLTKMMRRLARLGSGTRH